MLTQALALFLVGAAAAQRPAISADQNGNVDINAPQGAVTVHLQRAPTRHYVHTVFTSDLVPASVCITSRDGGGGLRVCGFAGQWPGRQLRRRRALHRAIRALRAASHRCGHRAPPHRDPAPPIPAAVLEPHSSFAKRVDLSFGVAPRPDAVRAQAATIASNSAAHVDTIASVRADASAAVQVKCLCNCTDTVMGRQLRPPCQLQRLYAARV